MEERIKAMYNECWAIYKQYLEDRDVAQYTQRGHELVKKYGGQSDIMNLVIWWSGRITGLHEEYMRCEHEVGR